MWIENDNDLRTPPDQRESMNCQDCNRSIDCGEIYYDGDDDPGNDECPHCRDKKKNIIES